MQLSTPQHPLCTGHLHCMIKPGSKVVVVLDPPATCAGPLPSRSRAGPRAVCCIIPGHAHGYACCVVCCGDAQAGLQRAWRAWVRRGTMQLPREQALSKVMARPELCAAAAGISGLPSAGSSAVPDSLPASPACLATLRDRYQQHRQLGRGVRLLCCDLQQQGRAAAQSWHALSRASIAAWRASVRPCQQQGQLPTAGQPAVLLPGPSAGS